MSPCYIGGSGLWDRQCGSGSALLGASVVRMWAAAPARSVPVRAACVRLYAPSRATAAEMRRFLDSWGLRLFDGREC